jgi:hypothetical protein
LSEAIRSNCPLGSSILVKPHPNAILRHTPLLREALNGGFNVFEADEAFRRYPVELWWPFLSGRTVIAPGHAALTLKHLFDVDVVQPMDRDAILRLTPEYLQPFLLHANDLTMTPLSRLPTWDGVSILHSGGRPQSDPLSGRSLS